MVGTTDYVSAEKASKIAGIKGFAVGPSATFVVRDTAANIILVDNGEGLAKATGKVLVDTAANLLSSATSTALNKATSIVLCDTAANLLSPGNAGALARADSIIVADTASNLLSITYAMAIANASSVQLIGSNTVSGSDAMLLASLKGFELASGASLTIIGGQFSVGQGGAFDNMIIIATSNKQNFSFSGRNGTISYADSDAGVKVVVQQGLSLFKQPPIMFTSGGYAGGTIRGAENVIGSKFDDTLEGDGNSILVGGSGNDRLKGWHKNYTAIYSGNRSEYDMSFDAAGGTFIISDSFVGRDGVDTVSGLSSLEFHDQSVDIASVGSPNRYVSRPAHFLRSMIDQSAITDSITVSPLKPIYQNPPTYSVDNTNSSINYKGQSLRALFVVGGIFANNGLAIGADDIVAMAGVRSGENLIDFYDLGSIKRTYEVAISGSVANNNIQSVRTGNSSGVFGYQVGNVLHLTYLQPGGFFNDITSQLLDGTVFDRLENIGSSVKVYFKLPETADHAEVLYGTILSSTELERGQGG